MPKPGSGSAFMVYSSRRSALGTSGIAPDILGKLNRGEGLTETIYIELGGGASIFSAPCQLRILPLSGRENRAGFGGSTGFLVF
jgi:hypothetical protein